MKICKCSACNCVEIATTVVESEKVCEGCAKYAVTAEGEVYCSKMSEYQDAGQFSGGNTGTPTGWISRPIVVKTEISNDN